MSIELTMDISLDITNAVPSMPVTVDHSRVLVRHRDYCLSGLATYMHVVTYYLHAAELLIN